MGAAYVFCETKDADGTARVKCMLGAGWTFSIMTYFIMFGIPGVAYWYALPKLHWIYSVMAYGITITGFISLARTSFGDPGIFPRYLAPKNGRWRYLAKTKSYRPPGVIFCSENAFLVEEMDHFCPWTGTTIAKLNLPYFHTFLCMLMAGLIYAMLVVALALGNNENPYLRGSRHTGQVTFRGNVCNEIKYYNPNAQKDPYGSVWIQCDSGKVIQEISFANWGLPEGVCGSYRPGKCGVDAVDWVKKQCEGHTACRLAPNHEDELGDPCFGIHKKFKVMAKCSPKKEKSVGVNPVIVPAVTAVATVVILAIAFAYCF